MPKGGCDINGKSVLEQAPGRICGPMEREEPTPEQLAARTCDPMGDPSENILFLKDCMPWEGLMLEQLVENCHP